MYTYVYIYIYVYIYMIIYVCVYIYILCIFQYARILVLLGLAALSAACKAGSPSPFRTFTNDIDSSWDLSVNLSSRQGHEKKA